MIGINTVAAEKIDVIPTLASHDFEIMRYRREWDCFMALRQSDEILGLAGKTDGMVAFTRVTEQ